MCKRNGAIMELENTQKTLQITIFYKARIGLWTICQTSNNTVDEGKEQYFLQY